MATTQHKRTNREREEQSEGPLVDLRRRIERARGPGESGPSLDTPSAEGENPLDLLRRRIESAARSPLPEAGRFERLAIAAPAPLDELYRSIATARRTLGEWNLDEELEREPNLVDPVEAFSSRIDREIARIGGRRALSLPRSSPDASRADRRRSEVGSEELEARLGRELLDLLAERDLPGSARAEAVALLVRAIDRPEPDRLREVLRVLLFPDESR